MKKEYLKTIREKCIEANPSILDLKFGCELRVKPYGISIAVPDQDFTATFVKWTTQTRFRHTQGVLSKSSIIEILGRELTLADVLLAINLQGDTNYECVRLAGSKLKVSAPNGKIETFQEEVRDGQYNQGENYCWTEFTFDLTKSVQDQEEEVLKFISELLGK